MGVIARYWLAATGFAVLLLMLFLGLTDTAWRVMGSPDEEYPELWFLGLGVPSSLAAAGFGLFWARVYTRQHRQPARAIGLWLAVFGAMVCLVLPALGVILIAESSVVS